jgi:hypothetical protein
VDRPEIGDTRYFVEYVAHAQGVALMKAAGADPDNDTMWDYCSPEDITARSLYFPAKWRAVQWARSYKKLDVFHMPRIVEQTYQFEGGDELRHPSNPAWTRTGYWEMNGSTEIEGETA